LKDTEQPTVLSPGRPAKLSAGAPFTTIYLLHRRSHVL